MHCESQKIEIAINNSIKVQNGSGKVLWIAALNDIL